MPRLDDFGASAEMDGAPRYYLAEPDEPNGDVCPCGKPATEDLYDDGENIAGPFCGESCAVEALVVGL